MFDDLIYFDLQVLNLSFNCLSAEDVISVGRLPRLKILHLTGNHLPHLPHLTSSNDTQKLVKQNYEFVFTCNVL